MATACNLNVEVIPRFMLQFPWAPKAQDLFCSTIVSPICLHNGQTRAFFLGFDYGYKLLFITANLEQMGIKADSVSFGSKKIIHEFFYLNSPYSEPVEMYLENRSAKEENSEIGIFSITFLDHSKQISLEHFLRNWNDKKFDEMISEWPFIFFVYVRASEENYQFQLLDSLLKNQLWATSVNRLDTDVEIHVQDKALYAHKAILAARSQVFNNLLNGDQISTTRQVIKIENCDAGAVEEFLYFLYSGSLMNTATNEQLMLLAELYEIKTLKTLCQAALGPTKKQISGRQALNFASTMTDLGYRLNPQLFELL